MVDEGMTVAEMQSRYYAGATLLAIARRCGKSQTYVWRCLVVHGTTIRHRGPKGHRDKTIRRIKFIETMLEKGISVADVAKRLRITRQAIYQLRAAGEALES